MKLYFSPAACSLAPHIVLFEAGIEHKDEKVDLKAHKTASGADFYAINPKGSVPTLELDNGELLTEAAVMVQYIADQKPDAKLLPPAGSFERVRAQEWLNFISSELHKSFGPLFNPTTPADYRPLAIANIEKKIDYLETHFAKGGEYLMGAFSVADAYLFTILNWTKFMQIDLARWPKVQAFYDRMMARPKVQTALKAEGLA